MNMRKVMKAFNELLFGTSRMLGQSHKLNGYLIACQRTKNVNPLNYRTGHYCSQAYHKSKEPKNVHVNVENYKNS